jgi:hypothetical protein
MRCPVCGLPTRCGQPPVFFVLHTMEHLLISPRLYCSGQGRCEERECSVCGWVVKVALHTPEHCAHLLAYARAYDAFAPLRSQELSWEAVEEELDHLMGELNRKRASSHD